MGVNQGITPPPLQTALSGQTKAAVSLVTFRSIVMRQTLTYGYAEQVLTCSEYADKMGNSDASVSLKRCNAGENKKPQFIFHLRLIQIGTCSEVLKTTLRSYHSDRSRLYFCVYGFEAVY